MAPLLHRAAIRRTNDRMKIYMVCPLHRATIKYGKSKQPWCTLVIIADQVLFSPFILTAWESKVKMRNYIELWELWHASPVLMMKVMVIVCMMKGYSERRWRSESVAGLRICFFERGTSLQYYYDIARAEFSGIFVLLIRVIWIACSVCRIEFQTELHQKSWNVRTTNKQHLLKLWSPVNFCRLCIKFHILLYLSIYV